MSIASGYGNMHELQEQIAGCRLELNFALKAKESLEEKNGLLIDEIIAFRELVKELEYKLSESTKATAARCVEICITVPLDSEDNGKQADGAGICARAIKKEFDIE